MNRTAQTLLDLAKKINETDATVTELRRYAVAPSGPFVSGLDLNESEVPVLCRVGDIGLRDVAVHMIGCNERRSLYKLSSLADKLVAESMARAFETHVLEALRKAEAELERLKEEATAVLVALGRSPAP